MLKLPELDHVAPPLTTSAPPVGAAESSVKLRVGAAVVLPAASAPVTTSVGALDVPCDQLKVFESYGPPAGVEASAAPYRNWNERITDECYRPNAEPVAVGAEAGAPPRMLPPNYSRMSFNFGPTLLSWLDRHAGDVTEAIGRAERDGRERYS